MKVITILVAFLTLGVFTFVGANLVQNLKSIGYPQVPWEKVEPLFNQGELSGFFLWDEVVELVDWLTLTFPDCATKTVIGKTYEGRNIISYALTDKTGITDINKSNKTIFLVTGLHHSREAVTLTMNLYLTLRWLHGYKNNDPVYIDLMRHTIAWFVPAVNLDGFSKINQIYKATKQLALVRKNRHVYSSACDEESVGVDINRNYGYKFGYDDQGSSPEPCAEDYRGPQAFSEPETRAIRDFVIGHPNLKMAVNFHAFGNLWIMPFNYDPDVRDPGVQKNSSEYRIYEEIHREGNLSKTALFGNAYSTIKYVANGEASDWMFSVHKIIAFSPELGDDDTIHANKFYPDRQYIPEIIQVAFGTTDYMYRKLLFDVRLDYSVTTDNSPDYIKEGLGSAGLKTFIVQIFNRGLTPLDETTIFLEKDQRDFETTATPQISLLYEVIPEEVFLNEEMKGTKSKIGAFGTFELTTKKITLAKIASSNSNRIAFEDKIKVDDREFLKLYIVIRSASIPDFNVKLSFPNGNLVTYAKYNAQLETQKPDNSLMWILMIGGCLVLVAVLFVIWKLATPVSEDKKRVLGSRGVELVID